MFNSWSKTQKSTPRPAAGDTPTSRTANLAMRRCTKPASPATCLPKITTTFLLTTHLRPELKHAPISWRINFLDTANAAVDNYQGDGDMDRRTFVGLTAAT